MATGKLSSIREAAKALRDYGVTVQWLKEEIAAGRIPALKIGKRVSVDVATVEQALVARAQGGFTPQASTVPDISPAPAPADVQDVRQQTLPAFATDAPEAAPTIEMAPAIAMENDPAPPADAPTPIAV